ncbi:MAG: hypothetical protein HYY40_10840 [Bacteroidetes bacterium]|nr:hypothetical protein [Bacteroidota bacterium]
MKTSRHYLIIAGAVLVALAFSSCKKEYSCTCTTTDSITGAVVGASTEYTDKMKKKDSEAWCPASATTSGGLTVTCTLAEK